MTGVGWAVVGLAGIAAALAGRGSLNALWEAFVVVFILGHGFEAVWKVARGTNALRLSSGRAPAR
jgi:hypothetical protein